MSKAVFGFGQLVFVDQEGWAVTVVIDRGAS